VKLIVDSGSTKAIWAFTKSGIPQGTKSTFGLNPYVQDISLLLNDLKSQFEEDQLALTHEIYFYGSGCKEEKVHQVRSLLRKLFLNAATIEVHSDLLGAARALFGHSVGLVCILGTGSNSAFFDGMHLNHDFPSLGYILGDEGAGFHIGKIILQDYFKGQLTENQKDLLTQQFHPPENLLQIIYESKHPNKEIARFSRYLQLVDKKYKSKVLGEVFGIFISKNIIPYLEKRVVPVGFCGSIAAHFEKELREQCSKFGITVAKVIKDPVNELINYHK
jgi:N-acetylglucosamine kinase-like BadF-type ATPase